MRRMLALALLLAATGGLAAPLPFATDFEQGIADAGFDSVAVSSSGDSVTTSAAAAHRGGLGMRVVDVTDASTSGSAAAGVINLGSRASIAARFWMRVTGVGPGALDIVQLISTGGPVNSIDDVNLAVPAGGDGGVVGSAGPDGTGKYYFEAHGQPFPLPQWHLVEVFASGIGTSKGLRELRVDGELQTSRTGLDWRGLTTFRFNFGEPWADDRSQTGTLDFDDLRLGEAPMASQFFWKEVSPGADGCRVLTLGLQTSTQVSATAPYDVVAILSGPEGLKFFADSGCSQTLSSVTLSAGSATAFVYVQVPGAQTQTITATQTDFLPGSHNFNEGDRVTPSAPLRLYDIGCESGSGEANGALLVLLLVLAVRARVNASTS